MQATNHPNDHNDITDALRSIRDELGLNPSGPQGTLQARVAANESNKLARDGHQAMTGDLNMAGNTIYNLDPTLTPGPNTVITKTYADDRYVNLSGDTMTGDLKLGGTPGPVSGQTGIRFTPDGWIASGVGDALVDSASVFLSRQGGGGAQATGQAFIVFRREASTPEIIGSIAINSGSSVAYNTSSDHRLKINDGPITDAVDRVAALAANAFRGRWTNDDGEGETWDMLYAHDIDAVCGYAVTGTKDAVDVDGNIVPQQTDYKALVPLLIAAIGDLTARVAALEAP